MADIYIKPGAGTFGTGAIDDEYDMEQGFNALTNGDTLYCKGGTYVLETEHIGRLKMGANNPNPVATNYDEGRKVTNFDSNPPIFDAQNIVWDDPGVVQGVILASNNQHYSTIDGLHIINIIAPNNEGGYPKVGVRCTYLVDNCKVTNCYTYNTCSSGIYVQGTGHIIDNNEVEWFTTCGSQEGITVYGSEACTVSNNYVHRCGNLNAHNNGIGIDFKDGGGGHKCFNNRVDNARIVGIYLDARGGVDGLEVYNNTIGNDQTVENTTNHGIVISDETPAGEVNGAITDTKVYNNIVTDMRTNGIVLGWAGFDGIELINTEVVNNVCTGNETGVAVYLQDKDAVPNPSVNNIIANNILWDNSVSSISATSTISNTVMKSDTNIMDGSVASSVVVENTITDDPLFVDATNYDFHLQDGSPGIGTGTNAYYVPTTDYDGNLRPIDVVDIGAYENQEGAATTGNYRLTGKAFSNNLGVMKRALTTTELDYLDLNPNVLGIIANGGTDANLPDLTQADFSNYVAFDEGVGTAHDDITSADYTLDDGAVWVEV